MDRMIFFQLNFGKIKYSLLPSDRAEITAVHRSVMFGKTAIGNVSEASGAAGVFSLLTRRCTAHVCVFISSED